MRMSVWIIYKFNLNSVYPFNSFKIFIDWFQPNRNLRAQALEIKTRPRNQG